MQNYRQEDVDRKADYRVRQIFDSPGGSAALNHSVLSKGHFSVSSLSIYMYILSAYLYLISIYDQKDRSCRESGSSK